MASIILHEYDEFDDDLWICKSPSVPRPKLSSSVAEELSNKPQALSEISMAASLFDHAQKSNSKSSISGALVRMRRKRLERANQRLTMKGSNSQPQPEGEPTLVPAARSGALSEVRDINSVSPWYRHIVPKSVVVTSVNGDTLLSTSASSEDGDEVEVVSFELDKASREMFKEEDIRGVESEGSFDGKPERRPAETEKASITEAKEHTTEVASVPQPIKGEYMPWKTSIANQRFHRHLDGVFRKNQNLSGVLKKTSGANVSDSDPSSLGSVPLASSDPNESVEPLPLASISPTTDFESSSSVSKEDLAKAEQEMARALPLVQVQRPRGTRVRISEPAPEKPSLNEDEYLLFSGAEGPRAATIKPPRWFRRFPRFLGLGRKLL